VAESFLASRSALADVMVVGRYGSPGGELAVRERRDLAIAHVAARRSCQAALTSRFAAQFGIALPAPLHWVAAGGLSAHGTGPGQWLVIDEASEGHALARRLAAGLSDVASVCDQSDMYAVLRVAGSCARDALAKGVQIDLHPRAFGPGRTATTVVHHIGVQIWQVDATPTFDMAVFRGFAGSFWDWFAASAAEFGYVVAG